jgi:hypothetical protein
MFFLFFSCIPNANAALGVGLGLSLGVRDYWCRLLTVYGLVFPVSQFTPVGNSIFIIISFYDYILTIIIPLLLSLPRCL